MPIYMDLHIVPGIEAKHAAEAHRQDLKVQDKYGIRCMTYWVDEERGSAFCLVDAPNKEAVKHMHDDAHGLVPHEIIQVNTNIVHAFLGRIQDPEGFNDLADPDLKIFNDPAFRIILSIEAKDRLLLINELGNEKAERVLALYAEVVREQVKNHKGSEVEMLGDDFLISFKSVSEAVDCAFAIQNALHIAAELVDLKIGVNAGMPVNKSKDLFGQTVDFARSLCFIGQENQIVLASIINEVYKPVNKQLISDKSRVRWMAAKNENFLELLMRTLKKHWNNAEFCIESFGEEMTMSKSQLYRKCMTIVGLSPNSLLREFRLKKARQLLKNSDMNVTQVIFEVGFNSPSYFTKCFQQRYGLQPLSYRKLKM